MRARPAAERFAEKVIVQPSGCWHWTASHNAKGYAYFHPAHGALVLAHRWAWEQKNGPVPEGLVLDHVVCDDPGCVNPDHLLPVTIAANTRRSPRTIASRNATKTHCPAGHAYDEANTIVRRTPTGGLRRDCRTCKNDAAKARRATA